jgi:hypothetical protein
VLQVVKMLKNISPDYTTLTAYADKLQALIGCCELRNWLSVDMVCVSYQMKDAPDLANVKEG